VVESDPLFDQCSGEVASSDACGRRTISSHGYHVSSHGEL
jgi:hypothetical protein